MSDPLLRYRDEFPILATSTYLVSNSLGAMPRTVPERLAEYAQQWATLGVRAWAQGWWEMPVSVGDEIAPLIGAGAGEVAMVPNVSVGQAQVLSALDYGGGRDTIVMTALDFPSVRYVYDELAARLGARIVVVPSDDGVGVSEERLIEAIDERTRLVAISHVTWTTGRVLPVGQIAALCREKGVPLLVDGAQSVGAIPVNVPVLGCDFYTVSGQKWLLGPDATGALYVRPDLVEKLAVHFPSGYGLASHDAGAPIAFAPGADRFDPGAVPLPALRGLLAALSFAAESGEERFDRARSMAARCRELLAERHEVLTEPDQATLVSFKPHGDPEQAVARLTERGVVVRGFPGLDWIRASVGFWTSEDELDRLLAALPG